jgi:membrane glycosyltransferase
MRAGTTVSVHTATTAATPLGPLAAVVSFIVILVLVLFAFILFVFVVVLLGLNALLGDEGHHAHPRRDRPLERRGAHFHGEHWPHADHQQ